MRGRHSGVFVPRFFHTALLASAFVWLAFGSAIAQTETFDELIEDALKRHQNAPGTQPGEPVLSPLPEAAPAAPAIAPAPSASPAPPAAVPVAPIPPALLQNQGGPKPYTPPKIAPPANATAEGGTPAAAPPASSDAVSGTAPAGTTAATTEAGERTRESLTPEEVNGAALVEGAPLAKGANPLVLKAQVLLDRAGASPGAIDAYAGGNLSKAVAAVETVLRLSADGVLDKAVWDALGGDAAPAVLVQYTITAEDLAYPFSASIPADYAEQAKLPNLNYTSPEEMFGERFHMDVKLLMALNPGADFRQAGTSIWVTAVEGPPIAAKVARIVADKALRQVRGYDAQDRLLVAYPATIGSPDNPSPSGEHLVKAVAPDPVYYYDPKNFVQGDNTGKLELPPGPNNPVGSVWIDLTEPSYGIHGTPEPTRIDKTGSHGCVRLTNWDAEELSKLVEPGVPVSFTE
jgi:lipoprotein-anchoring transpeptidase ErfK/SrfK